MCGHIYDLWPPLPTDPLGRAAAICEAVDAAFLAAQTLAGPVDAIRRLDTTELPGLAQGTERAALCAIWISIEEAHHVAHELKNALISAACAQNDNPLKKELDTQNGPS